MNLSAANPDRGIEAEPLFAPALSSLLLHAALFGALLLYGFLGGLFHHNFWGSPGSGGAIQVSLVSSALPLPSDQPPNKNVLSTETPSEAPAEPAPKEKQAVDESAIPITGKEIKPQQQTTTKTQQHQPQTDNRAQYGEQSGSSMARATQAQTGPPGPTSVSDGDFGSRFGYYVDNINRMMGSSWYRAEVNSATPKGARVYLTFTLHRDGKPAEIQVDRSSGSPTLDRSCQRGAQRVDTFGVLPAAYNQSTLKVSFYCEY